MNNLIQYFVGVLLLTPAMASYSQLSVVPVNTTNGVEDLAMDEDTLLISSYQYFGKTFDLGKTINEILNPKYGGTDFHVINGNYYVLSGKRGVSRSRDRGLSWEIIYYDSLGDIRSFSMCDSTFGVIAGWGNQLLSCQSSDTNWTPVYVTPAFPWGNNDFENSATDGDSTALVVSRQGATARTTDRGQTWETFPGPGIFTDDLEFEDDSTVFALCNSSGLVWFRSSFNRGKKFTGGFLLGDADVQVTDLCFESPKHGFITGYRVIWETNDSGKTFVAYDLGYEVQFNTMVLANDSVAFIGGNNGLLLKWDRKIPLKPLVNNELFQIPGNIFPYPNPSDGKIEFQIPPGISGQFALLDLHGRGILSQEVFENLRDINIVGIPPGIYIWRFTGDDGQSVSGKLTVLR